MIEVEKAGLQTTIQDLGREHWRHMGVPTCGAADGLSAAIANRIVGNSLAEPVVEIYLSETSYRFGKNALIAVTGAPCNPKINGATAMMYTPLLIRKGDRLTLDHASSGARSYIAIQGKIKAERALGGVSTFLPAQMGGFHGRALKVGDVLEFHGHRSHSIGPCPREFQPHISNSWLLRTVKGAEFEQLSDKARAMLLENHFSASHRSNRMGIELDGAMIAVKNEGMNSSAVFTGTLQCPPSGNPFLLCADAQTTGGYPRLLQVIRADLHLLGQIRPGDSIRFLMVDVEIAIGVLKEKISLYEPYLGNEELAKVFK